MSARDRYLSKQAKALAAKPNPSGLADEVSRIACQFKINNRCQKTTAHLEYDPTGETKLPAPSCNGCHSYLERAYQCKIASEEANVRIKLAILATYERLMEYGE